MTCSGRAWPDRPDEKRIGGDRPLAAPRLDDVEGRLKSQLPKSPAETPRAATIRHAPNTLKLLRLCLEHGFPEIDNDPGERGMRSIALDRKNHLLMGSSSVGKAAAIACTLIESARLNSVDPTVRFAQVLERMPDHKVNRVIEPCHGAGRRSQTVKTTPDRAKAVRPLTSSLAGMVSNCSVAATGMPRRWLLRPHVLRRARAGGAAGTAMPDPSSEGPKRQATGTCPLIPGNDGVRRRQ